VAKVTVAVDGSRRAVEHEPRANTIAIPEPRPKRPVLRRGALWAVAVASVLSVAWGVWSYALPHRVRVPDVKGISLKAATARLVDAGLEVRIGAAVYSTDVGAGNVVTTRPPTGTTLDHDAVVTIVPSLGSQPIEIPTVHEMTAERATHSLIQAGLQVAGTKRRYSDIVPAGRVIATDPAAGRQAHLGDELMLIVSKGPAPIAVPDLRGVAVDAAAERLRELGFRVRVKQAFSPVVRRGFVVSQDPVPPDEESPGSTVTIVTSLGPRTFAVDSYLGLSKQDAVAAIRESGLVPSVRSVPGGVSGRVVGQSPDPGHTVHAGDTITIFVA
jgi:serine/threonine-protein kinase